MLCCYYYCWCSFVVDANGVVNSCRVVGVFYVVIGVHHVPSVYHVTTSVIYVDSVHHDVDDVHCVIVGIHHVHGVSFPPFKWLVLPLPLPLHCPTC